MNDCFSLQRFIGEWYLGGTMIPWRNVNAQKSISKWTHLDKIMLFCGKFNVGSVPGIIVVLVASKKISHELVKNKMTHCQITNKVRCNSNAQ